MFEVLTLGTVQDRVRRRTHAQRQECEEGRDISEDQRQQVGRAMAETSRGNDVLL